uniref:Amidase domain-containing protein n=1 Tax=Plectus sambesii TaxID=2011161 RepID=A0A914XHP6_9BILA
MSHAGLLASGYDSDDCYSLNSPSGIPSAPPQHLCFAVPAVIDFNGDQQSSSAFDAALKQFEAQGATLKPIDFDVFEQVSALLYNGPWVAERYAAIEPFIEAHSEAIRPVTRNILYRAKNYSAADAFNAFYKLSELKRKADGLMEGVDALIVPTAVTHFTIAEVEADPISPINILGKYSNFVNLLGYSALSVPAGFRADSLPFGVTLIARGWHDSILAQIGERWQEHVAPSRGATRLPFKKTS